MKTGLPSTRSKIFLVLPPKRRDAPAAGMITDTFIAASLAHLAGLTTGWPAVWPVGPTAGWIAGLLVGGGGLADGS